QCADGYVAVTAGGRQADALFAAGGKPDLGQDPGFLGAARARNYRALTQEIEEWRRTVTVAEGVAALGSVGVASAEVRAAGQAVSDPLAMKRGDTVPLLHPTLGAHPEIPVTGMPVHFANAKVGFDRPSPAPGEHNEAVYGGLLGYSADRIAQMRA